MQGHGHADAAMHRTSRAPKCASQLSSVQCRFSCKVQARSHWKNRLRHQKAVRTLP